MILNLSEPKSGMNWKKIKVVPKVEQKAANLLFDVPFLRPILSYKSGTLLEWVPWVPWNPQHFEVYYCGTPFKPFLEDPLWYSGTHKLKVLSRSLQIKEQN